MKTRWTAFSLKNKSGIGNSFNHFSKTGTSYQVSTKNQTFKHCQKIHFFVDIPLGMEGLLFFFFSDDEAAK